MEITSTYNAGRRSVLILNDYGSVTGGADQMARLSAKALAEQGWQVGFLAAVGTVDCPDLIHAGVEVVGLGQRDLLTMGIRGAIRGIWNFQAARLLDRWLQARPRAAFPQVALLHSYSKAFTASIVPVLKRRGIRVAVVLNDYFCFSPNGIHFHYGRGEPMEGDALRWANIFTNADRRHWSHHLFRSLRVAVQRMSKTIPRSVDCFFAVSRRSAKYAQGHLPRGTIIVVENPGPPPALESARPWLFKQIIFVGRAQREKGILEIAQAAWNSGLPLCVAGKCDLRREILARNPATEFVEWMNPFQLRSLVRRSRLLVLGSLWFETFGLVVAEALAEGVPVVVSTRAGASALVEDNVNGRLWSPPSIDELTSIFECAANDDVIEGWSAGAVRRYPDLSTSPEKYARRLSGALSELVQLPGPRALCI